MFDITFAQEEKEVLEVGPSGQQLLKWEGKPGRTYFIEWSTDLENWSYARSIHTGEGEPLTQEFSNEFSGFFTRFRYTDLPHGGDPRLADFDQDGLTSWDELTHVQQTDPFDPDTDGDTLLDGFEITYSLNPTLQDSDRNGVADGMEDFDRDSLTNAQEQNLKTDPTRSDSDHDGIADGVDRDPTINLAQANPDGENLPPSLNVGLLGRWDFEEKSGTRFFDLSGNNWHGMIKKASSSVEKHFSQDGVVAGSLKLNGTADSVAQLPPFEVEEDRLTLSLWFKMTPDSGNGASGNPRLSNLVSFVDHGGSFVMKLQLIGAGSILLADGVSSASWVLPRRVDDGRWHHLVTSHNNGRNSRLYLDGENLGERSFVLGRLSDHRPLYLAFGQDLFFTGLSPNPVRVTSDVFSFDGGIDRVRLYRRTLDDSEISALYHQDADRDGLPDIREKHLGTNPFHVDSDLNGTLDGAEDYTAIITESILEDPDGAELLPSLDRGLIGRWDLEENRDKLLLDSSGNDWHASLFREGGASEVTYDRNGVSSRGLEFPGVHTAYARAPERNIELDEATVSLWFKAGADSQQSNEIDVLFNLSSGVNAADYFLIWSRYLQIGSTQEHHLGINFGPGLTFYTLPQSIYDGKWHHLVVRRHSGSLVHAHLDGVDLGERTSTYTRILDHSPSHLVFGQYYFPGVPGYRGVYAEDFSYSGSLDRVRLYDRRLTSREVRSLLFQDVDGDGLADFEETKFGTNVESSDTDGDGLTDHEEVKPAGHTFGPTNPLSSDSDGDQIPDQVEIDSGLNPNRSTGDHGQEGDPDRDSLSNFSEFLNGTGPNNPDSDGDGIPDGEEVNNGSDPNDPSDGGNPPEEGVEEVFFRIGDPSGSHSENWMITVTGVGLDPDKRMLRVKGRDFGVMSDSQMHKLRVGKQYEITIDHLGTDPEFLAENGLLTIEKRC